MNVVGRLPRLVGPLVVALFVVALFAAAPAANAGVIVWAKNPSTNAPSGTWGEVWVSGEDGSNPRVLFAPAGKLPGIPAPYAAGQLRSPQLSDDGKTLTFSAQWNRLWFRGLARSCGLGCEGIYQVKDGAVTRISPDPTDVATNGCPGAATTDLCESFESGAVQFGNGIVFSFQRNDWTACLASCPSSPTSSSTSIVGYDRQAGGTFAREEIFSRASCSNGSREPDTFAFDATSGTNGGLILNGCTSASSGGPVSTPDGNGGLADIGVFHRLPEALALAPDLSRVLAGDAKPAIGDETAVWSFPVVQGGASALTPADYLVAIHPDPANALLARGLALGATTLWTDASDGNLWRWPVTCGTSVSCRFGQEGVRVTNDSGGTLSAPNGFWSGFVRFNRDPRWSPATSVDIGWPPPAPAAPAPAPPAVPAPAGARAIRLTPPASPTAKALGKRGLPLSIDVPAAGTVTVTATVPARALGRKGKPVLIGTATARPKAGGRVTVRLRLNANGRRYRKKLKKGVVLTLRITQGATTVTRTLRLR